jgi:hypothetical protein
MQLLTRAALEDWRFGRVPYLERVINRNLSRLSALPRILRFHAHDLNLKPSATAALGQGAQAPAALLQIRRPHVEAAYATHLVRLGKKPVQPDTAVVETAESAAA